MNNLVKSEVLTLDSREVAKMVKKDHAHLMRDVDTYIEYLKKSEKPKLDFQNFFIEDTYKAEGNNKTYKCYQVTKKGCELIAHKMTGEKGILFTATYINRFHDMEQALKQPVNQKQVISVEEKHKSIEARYNNSLARKANILLKMTKMTGITDQYKQVLCSYASAIIADKPLIPLPEISEKTLTAEEVGKQLGITANKVGRIAKEHNLKVEKYGKWFHDKSRYSNKEVPSFRYFENVIPVIGQILKEVS